MAVRETINQRRGAAVAVTAVVILLMLGTTVYRMRSSSIDGQEPAATNKQWVTTDYGKSWIAADINRLPPFADNGKTAFGCAVWSIDNGKTIWVSHLYRYTEEGKKRFSEPGAQALLHSPMRLEMMQVRRPGESGGDWVKATDPNGVEIQIPAADDKGAVPVPVYAQ